MGFYEKDTIALHVPTLREALNNLQRQERSDSILLGPLVFLSVYLISHAYSLNSACVILHWVSFGFPLFQEHKNPTGFRVESRDNWSPPYNTCALLMQASDG